MYFSKKRSAKIRQNFACQRNNISKLMMKQKKCQQSSPFAEDVISSQQLRSILNLRSTTIITSKLAILSGPTGLYD
jgi:hypothetical protein